MEREKQRSLDQLGTEATKQADRLRQELNKYKEDAERTQAELDRLLLILQESENEKRAMDQKIKELQRLAVLIALVQPIKLLKLLFDKFIARQTILNSGFNFPVSWSSHMKTLELGSLLSQRFVINLIYKLLTGIYLLYMQWGMVLVNVVSVG